MIEDARWRRVEEICGGALDLTGDDRTSFVAAACGHDEALRQEVEALLMRASSAATFLGASIGVAAAQVLSDMRGTALVGRQIGAYTVLSLLGAGGMGEVYRARDPRLARDVAIKVLPADPTPDRSRSRRFLREAQAIAGLNHPHICVVHDVGEQEGISYLVMEYLEGQTLRERLRDAAPLPLPDGLTIALEVAEALVEAHRHGIVHRDVKPGNIMLTGRGTKLLDFGLARPVEAIEVPSTTALTSAGVVLGTPHYMSPEQARGQPVDARSDVFSLGAVIYEMVTGCRPFDGVNAIDTIDAVLHQEPRAVAELRPEAPAALGSLIAKCLAKDNDDRYQSVEQVWTDLLDLRHGTTPRTWIQPPPLRRHNLPLQVTSFVGRESEVAELCSALAETRLLTLSGSGGCGKTRLALTVASTVADNYPDGVCLTELAAVTDGELIAQSVASALGVEEEPGRPLQQRLADYLEAKRLLLVLDNCEHLVATAAPFVQSILTSCEGLQILATSRDPLRIPGERVWRVPPLSVPESASVPLAEVSGYEGVRLFVERARAVSPLILDHASANHVVEICRRLDGIPLALEMAAARLDVLSLDQIASRLNDRFGLLTRAHRTSARRQETLRSTIDWSYDLLSPLEQTLFRRLAVFAGTFSLEAAEAVCSGSDLRSGDVLEVLSGLVEKSLMTVSRTNLGVRYRLLETVREYALDKFRRNAADERRTRNRHLGFFLAFAEPLEAEFYSRLTARAHDRVEQEHQNLLAALDWCNLSPRRSEAALRLVTALMPFWSARCYHNLGKQLSLRALDHDQRRSPTSVLIKALDVVGYFLGMTGELEAARVAHEESRRRADESGDAAGAARALWQLGILASMQGRDSDAEALQTESLAISRRYGLKLPMARALGNLGIHAFHRRDYALAQTYWQERHVLFRELGFEIGLTGSLLNHAALAHRTDPEQARSLAAEALSKARETGHKDQVSFALVVLGNLHLAIDRQRSRALYEEALAIARGLGYKRRVANALYCLGHLSATEGRFSEAEGLLNESFALLTQLHEDRSADAADCLEALGWVALDQGRFDDALELADRALSITGARIGKWDPLRLAGSAHLALGDQARARAAFEESLALAKESADIGGVAGAKLGIGSLELIANCPREARSLLQSALPVFETVKNEGRIIDTLMSLAEASLLEGDLHDAAVTYLRAFRLARDLGLRKEIARVLRSVGIITSRRQRLEPAAKCFGAGKALLEASGGAMAWFESIGYDEAVEAVRSALGPDRFQRLWDEGYLTPIDRIDELLGEEAVG